MKEENEAVIRALNKYGRVPQIYELLNEIDRLNKEVEKLNKYVYRIQQVITDDLISKIGDINDE